MALSAAHYLTFMTVQEYTPLAFTLTGMFLLFLTIVAQVRIELKTQ
jgi:hypothetical protein